MRWWDWFGSEVTFHGEEVIWVKYGCRNKQWLRGKGGCWWRGDCVTRSHGDWCSRKNGRHVYRVLMVRLCGEGEGHWRLRRRFKVAYRLFRSWNSDKLGIYQLGIRTPNSRQWLLTWGTSGEIQGQQQGGGVRENRARWEGMGGGTKRTSVHSM